MKVDDDDEVANVRTHESCGVGDRCRRRIVGTWGCMEMGKSGARCNMYLSYYSDSTQTLLRLYSDLYRNGLAQILQIYSDFIQTT